MELAVAVMLAAFAVRGSMAASPPPPPSSLPCMSQLTACSSFFSFINPPASCCVPLRDAFVDDLQCFCYVFDNPDVFGAFKIDANTFMSLFTNCNITDASTSSNPNGINAGHKTMRIGASGFMFFLLFWWSLVA
ncbi:uncharacterized protein [Typha angustifolia]|uniref:uncharacterized protein n=1 Tax=Typha angustifolia TaxID=59011 RepID=UPI003C2B0754